jgi:ABC-2 type transport system ATP-binding protein
MRPCGDERCRSRPGPRDRTALWDERCVSTGGRSSAAVIIPPGSMSKFGLRADACGAGGADAVLMRTTQAAAVIAVEGLTKRYGAVIAVEDLSFSVRPGAVTGFLGPNGAGKTTALKAIVGLARPTAGRALVNDTPIDALVPDARMLGVYIESCGAHPGRSARDHLRALAALAGLARGRVDEVLAIVGLEEAACRRVGTYSTGMRQRLGLASALLGDPEILVLDEPLNGLDPQGIRWLRRLLRARAASGGTVLLSSHVLTEVAQTVDDVVVIHRGRLVRQGTIEDLERLGDGGVSVRTPMPERLATAVERAGGRVAFQYGAGRLLVEGMDAARVGELAHGERVMLQELMPRGGSLEDVFFSLTEAEEETA